jgi:hypothetical protein
LSRSAVPVHQLHEQDRAEHGRVLRPLLWTATARLPASVELNWLKTNPGQGYLVALWLYGSMQPFFDQTWIPDDLVKMK